MNLIWRFYSGPDHRWRWQHLSFDGTVVAESQASYSDYERCTSDASGQGYVFLPSRSTRPRTSPAKVGRTYVHKRKVVKPLTGR